MAFSPVSASLSLSSCLAFRFLQVAYVVTQYESFSAFWAECVCMAEWLESVGGGTLSLEHVKVADQKWILIIKQTAKIQSMVVQLKCSSGIITSRFSVHAFSLSYWAFLLHGIYCGISGYDSSLLMKHLWDNWLHTHYFTHEEKTVITNLLLKNSCLQTATTARGRGVLRLLLIQQQTNLLCVPALCLQLFIIIYPSESTPLMLCLFLQVLFVIVQTNRGVSHLTMALERYKSKSL